MLQNSYVLLTLDKSCTIPCACHAKWHLSVQTWSRTPGVLSHFDFEMCFAPQRRALFRHLNLQKRSRTCQCFVTFWLRNVFRARTACTFSTSNFQKWSGPGVFTCILTSKCASRHNGVHFFDISTVQKWSEHVVFCSFLDLQMCFAPQRRAIFHLSSGQMAPHPPL